MRSAWWGDIPWWLLLLGLELPAVLALLDCTNRPPGHFLGGAQDRRSWQGWLIVAVLTVPILVGYLVLVGYYYAVIRRNSPASRDCAPSLGRPGQHRELVGAAVRELRNQAATGAGGRRAAVSGSSWKGWSRIS